MKAEAKTFRLSRRLSIEITAGVDGIEVEWEPSIPGELTKAEMEKYQDAMAELFERLASDAVVIVDVGTRRENTH